MTDAQYHERLRIEAEYAVQCSENRDYPLSALIELQREGVRQYGLDPWREAMAEAYRAYFED